MKLASELLKWLVVGLWVCRP